MTVGVACKSTVRFSTSFSTTKASNRTKGEQPKDVWESAVTSLNALPAKQPPTRTADQFSSTCNLDGFGTHLSETSPMGFWKSPPSRPWFPPKAGMDGAIVPMGSIRLPRAGYLPDCWSTSDAARRVLSNWLGNVPRRAWQMRAFPLHRREDCSSSKHGFRPKSGREGQRNQQDSASFKTVDFRPRGLKSLLVEQNR